ncbi:MAG: AzlD domain-containing protein [Pseudomonadota bacterium]
MTQSDPVIWFIIVGLAVGSFAIRFSFLGLLGNRQLPDWFLRYLRYTPVAVIPALIAPMVVWPEANGGNPDAARLLSAIAVVTAGYVTKNVFWAILAGVTVLSLGLTVF